MSLDQKAAAARQQMAQQNPATATRKTAGERKRVPFSAPVRKLEVPPIPGFYLYWVEGTPSEIARAQAAGFEFVDASEIPTNDVALAGDGLKSGSTDLGSRVSVVAGGEAGGDGQPVRLYLMKQKLEYYEEDQQLIADRNASVVEALTSQFQQGTVGGRAEGETAEDVGKRYVRRDMTKIPDIFKPKQRRA